MKFTVAKKAIALTGAVAMLGSVAACGSDTASGKPAQDKDVTEITVWAWEPTLTQVAKDFTKKTGIKVDLKNVGTNTKEYTQLDNAIEAGSGAPDVAQVEYYAIPQYAIKGNLLDITDKTSGKITIAADDNVMDYVVVEANGGQLTATIDKSINNLSNADVTVTVPANGSIRALDASSAAKISGDVVLNADKFAMDASSAAKIDVSVKAQSCAVAASSASNINASVEAVSCSVEASSASKITLKGSAAKCTADLSSASKLSAGEFVVAECCKPIPGDKVVGFRDPQSGKIIVHKATCEELNRLASQFGRNIIKDEIKWSQHKAVSYLSTIELRGIDRTGILLDLANVISRDFSINIREIGIQSHDGIFEGTLSLYVKNAESLSVVLENLRKIKGMESVKRNL